MPSLFFVINGGVAALDGRGGGTENAAISFRHFRQFQTAGVFREF
jgi:hypothetical protein